MEVQLLTYIGLMSGVLSSNIQTDRGCTYSEFENRRFAHVFAKFNVRREYLCYKTCRAFSRCVSVNWHENINLCELSDTSNEEYPNGLEAASGIAYLVPKDCQHSLDPCDVKPCKSNDVCIPVNSGQSHICLPEVQTGLNIITTSTTKPNMPGTTTTSRTLSVTSALPSTEETEPVNMNNSENQPSSTKKSPKSSYSFISTGMGNGISSPATTSWTSSSIHSSRYTSTSTRTRDTATVLAESDTIQLTTYLTTVPVTTATTDVDAETTIRTTVATTTITTATVTVTTSTTETATQSADVDVTSITGDVAITEAPFEYLFIGCYDISNSMLSSFYKVETSSDTTHETCSYICGNHEELFFGIEKGMNCYCGKAVNTGELPLAAEECNKSRCKGNDADYCGGAWSLAVFEV